MKLTWKHFAPIVVAIVIALIPAPAGLPQHAWYYFAIFAGVIVGLMLEPLPGGAIGLIGVTLVARLSDYVFYSPEQLAKPGFNPDTASLSWALSGFSNSTVWLIFGAFMFALGYEKTGLGRRIALMLVKAMGRKTLTLGYAVAIADTILAPFTPSNTARSGGTIYPVIRNLPLLYDSKPNDPSRRRMGSYIMWVAISATCVTSTLFLTALAPNLLAVELVKKTAKIDLAWVDWFIAAAPMGILLLIFVPLLAYWIYPPEVKEGAEVSDWAAKELVKMGGLTAKEITLAVLVVIALAMWIFRAEASKCHDGCIDRHLPDARHQCGDLGRHYEKLPRVEHSRMVCNAGRAGRRAQSSRIRQVVCRSRGEPYGWIYACQSNIAAARDQLFHPLYVCQRHRACHRADPGVARRRFDHSRYEHAAPRAIAVSPVGNHGHHHALWHRPEPGILRQRLFAGSRLLAARRYLWIDLSSRIHGDHRALGSRRGLSI